MHAQQQRTGKSVRRFPHPVIYVELRANNSIGAEFAAAGRNGASTLASWRRRCIRSIGSRPCPDEAAGRRRG
jgi:hypothetical protein